MPAPAESPSLFKTVAGLSLAGDPEAGGPGDRGGLGLQRLEVRGLSSDCRFLIACQAATGLPVFDDISMIDDLQARTHACRYDRIY